MVPSSGTPISEARSFAAAEVTSLLMSDSVTAQQCEVLAQRLGSIAEHPLHAGLTALAGVAWMAVEQLERREGGLEEVDRVHTVMEAVKRTPGDHRGLRHLGDDWALDWLPAGVAGALLHRDAVLLAVLNGALDELTNSGPNQRESQQLQALSSAVRTGLDVLRTPSIPELAQHIAQAVAQELRAAQANADADPAVSAESEVPAPIASRGVGSGNLPSSPPSVSYVGPQQLPFRRSLDQPTAAGL